MLADYDAKGVAEVMGIAFVRDPEGEPAPDKPAKLTKLTSADPTESFVITVGGTHVRVVAEESFGRGVKKVAAGATLSMKAEMRRFWSPSSALIEKAVEKGLPRHVLRHVAEQIVGTDKAKIASLEWIVVPKSTLERREQQLSPQESERTERVARLFVHARRALGSQAEAQEFMTAPHPQLDERSPIDAAKTDFGTRRTEQILNALEYGLAL